MRAFSKREGKDCTAIARRNEFAKRSIIAAAAVSLSLFISQPVLAEGPYTCAYKKDKDVIEYVHGGKSNSASIKDFSEKFGNLLAFDCSENFTIMIFERSIVRAAGGKRVISAGTLSIPHPTNPTLFKEGSIIGMTEGIPAKVKIQWGRVAVLLLKNKSVLTIKGLQDEEVMRVLSPAFNEIDISNCDIRISGSELNTTIELKSGNYKKTLIVEGKDTEKTKIKER
jgi:hypothetical protein